MVIDKRQENPNFFSKKQSRLIHNANRYALFLDDALIAGMHDLGRSVL